MIAGQRGRCVLALTQVEYLQLVDYSGRQLRADKRGVIAGPPPTILRRLGYSPDSWTRQVLDGHECGTPTFQQFLQRDARFSVADRLNRATR